MNLQLDVLLESLIFRQGLLMHVKVANLTDAFCFAWIHRYQYVFLTLGCISCFRLGGLPLCNIVYYNMKGIKSSSSFSSSSSRDTKPYETKEYAESKSKTL
jgi:hypothetical protein